MRFFLLFLIVSSTALLAPNVAAAETTRSIDLKASVVDFYSNRYIITADGNVRARLSDGTVVTGDAFTMDLKLNRFLIAGNVHIDGPRVHQVGAAFAGYPDIDRNYFLSEGTLPDRWTYFSNDFADEHPGREQPGDAFFFPDLSNEKPYIISNSATIFFKNNVEFPIGARINVLGVYVLTPGYVANFSANPNFYQNAFAGGIFDIGIPFHGSDAAISAAHIRYDQFRGLYTAFDQHFVHNLDYAVFSVDPVTQTSRQTIAILYKRLSPDVEAKMFFQLFTESQGFNQPTNAGTFTNFAVNARVGRYAVGLNSDQVNNYLLGDPMGIQVQHPFDMTLSLQSYEDEFRLFRYVGVPVKFQYRAGYGYNYNSYGLAVLGSDAALTPPDFGGSQYNMITNRYVGFTAYTNSMKIAKDTSISAKADRLETWYSLPHHTVTTDVSTTIAHTPPSVKIPAFLLTYDVLNIGDFYGAQQRNAYPAFQDVVPTQFGTFSGLSAFDGFATSRSITGSIIYTPTPYFALNLTMQNFNVFPAPVPGLGGQPPNQFTADVRIRISRQVLVDVSRVYYFQFAGQGWAPQYGVQFSP